MLANAIFTIIIVLLSLVSLYIFCSDLGVVKLNTVSANKKKTGQNNENKSNYPTVNEDDY